MAIIEGPVTHNSNFEEGRRTHSRSSSHDSDSSPRTRAVLLAPDSGDEAETPGVNNRAATAIEPELEAPLVRPPVVPVWGGGSAFGGFNQRSTSSPFRPQSSTSTPQPEPENGREGSSDSMPGYPTGDIVSDNNATNTLRVEDTGASRKTSIPSLLISAAASISSVPPSLHDFSSPQAGLGASFLLTTDSSSSIINAGTPNTSTSTPTDRKTSPPSPPPSQPANNHHQPTTQSGTPGRGRGAKRGTKPGAKRGEWRVKNYTGNNTSASGEPVQPADPSTYSSSFKVVPFVTAPAVDHESTNAVQNGNHQVASTSSLRLQVPSEHGSRSASSREHSSEGDDYNNGVADISQYHPPPSPQPHPDSMAVVAQGPAPRLVAIVIEDKRYGCTDLQLVEVVVPVRQSSDGGLWVEAENVCEALQGGPSRVDGPAKVYTYRGTYRQYFLRVSIDNRDTYGPANLTINQKRVLKAFVEPDMPPRTVVVDHADPSSATHPYRSQLHNPAGYLASPATSGGASDYARSPVDYNQASSRNLLKRNYGYSESSSPGFHAVPSPPIPSSSTSKKPRRQQSGNNA